VKRTIKLLHVTTSLKIGGAEAVLCDLVRRLGNDEFEHHVIYFHDGPNVQKIKDIGAKTYNITGLLCLYDPFFFAKLFLLIKKLNPDVIHSLLWSANISSRLVAKFLKKPLVSAYHLDIYNDGILRNSIDALTRRMSDLIVAVSDDVAKSLGKKNLQRSGKKTQVITNGIDFDAIYDIVENSRVAREELGLSEQDFVIGSVGRLHPQKNFPLLLKSFFKISTIRQNARLVIVGVGHLEKALKDLACRLGIRDKVCFIIGKQACNYYPIFDCFVQSSLKEGLSIALLEAMCFELPCIVTNKGEQHPVIVHKKNGIIVESQNQNMLCEAILGILDNRAFGKIIAKEAKKVVLEGFSVDKMVGKYKSLFCSLADGYSNSKLDDII